MRPSKGGGGNLMHYIILGLVSVIVKEFFASQISVGS